MSPQPNRLQAVAFEGVNETPNAKRSCTQLARVQNSSLELKVLLQQLRGASSHLERGRRPHRPMLPRAGVTQGVAARSLLP